MSDNPREARRTFPLWAVLALMAAFVAIGVGGWLLWRSTQPATFGWFAYAPLSETTYSMPHASSQPLGIALLVVGTSGLSALAGYALGRRRT
ncbi:MAG: hypothetical protein AAGC49_05510 [Brevundimonas sp.]